MVERFKVPSLTDEITKLVSSDPLHAQDCEAALGLFVGDGLTASTRKNLQVRRD